MGECHHFAYNEHQIECRSRQRSWKRGDHYGNRKNSNPIDVYYDAESVDTESVVYDLMYGRLLMITDDQVCGDGAMNMQ